MRLPERLRRSVRRRPSIHRFGPWVLVLVAVVFGLWVLRAEATPVQNLNDGSIHRSMISWAEGRWSEGHLPLDGWYPNVSLGSSRFHHYQSLPHVVTGLAATVLGSERAYSWSLYLLLSLLPLSVFAGGRLFGFGRWRSACGALASPLIASAPTLGFEWGSYAWRGYGTWTQLWGMWLLPIAWGLGFRAVSRGRSSAWAALAIALTVAVHLLTGYLALLSLGVFVLVRPTRFVQRFGRAAIVGAGSLAIAAWVVVPLLLDRSYTIQDEFSRGKVYYDSFGANRILRWLASGEIFDRNRFPSLTILVGLGLLVCLVWWRRDVRVRALVGVALLSLLLFFGRSTLGPALELLPGSGDLFLRRYVFGVHLAGLYLAGYAMVAIGRFAFVLMRRWRWLGRRPRGIALAPLVVAVVAALAPAWLERSAWAATGARWIHEQQLVDANEGADVAALVEIAAETGPGRIYGGLRSNWGSTYRIGQVPMFAMLTNLDTNQVGFTRPTWSLASPAEYRFRDTVAAHYDVFDVRYLIQPADRDPPTSTATVLATEGEHTLYELPTDGLVDLMDVGEPIRADRTNLGAMVAPWLSSTRPSLHIAPGISFAAFEAAAPTVAPGEIPATPPGILVGVTEAIGDGFVGATVRLDRPAAVILKASFDNRWRVRVDGRPLEPQMFAPGFVGRVVPAGRHSVVFSYAPFPRYDVLLLVGAGAFLGLVLLQRRGSASPPSGPAARERERAATVEAAAR